MENLENLVEFADLAMFFNEIESFKVHAVFYDVRCQQFQSRSREGGILDSFQILEWC